MTSTEALLEESEHCLVLNQFTEAEEKAAEVLKRCHYLNNEELQLYLSDRAAVVVLQALYETNRFSSARHILHSSFGTSEDHWPINSLLLYLSFQLDGQQDTKCQAQSLIFHLLKTQTPGENGWTRRRYLALLHLYVMEVLVPGLKDPSEALLWVKRQEYLPLQPEERQFLKEEINAAFPFGCNVGDAADQQRVSTSHRRRNSSCMLPSAGAWLEMEEGLGYTHGGFSADQEADDDVETTTADGGGGFGARPHRSNKSNKSLAGIATGGGRKASSSRGGSGIERLKKESGDDGCCDISDDDGTPTAADVYEAQALEWQLSEAQQQLLDANTRLSSSYMGGFMGPNDTAHEESYLLPPVADLSQFDVPEERPETELDWLGWMQHSVFASLHVAATGVYGTVCGSRNDNGYETTTTTSTLTNRYNTSSTSSSTMRPTSHVVGSHTDNDENTVTPTIRRVAALALVYAAFREREMIRKGLHSAKRGFVSGVLDLVRMGLSLSVNPMVAPR